MVSAPVARRQKNMRFRARPGIPAADKRIQPLPPGTAELHTDWARNLKNRTGWYGIKTRQHGVLLLFTIVMDRKTHYSNLKNKRAVYSGHHSLHQRLAL